MTAPALRTPHPASRAARSGATDRVAEGLLPEQCSLTLLGSFELRCGGALVDLPTPAQRVLAFLALQGRPLLRPYVAGMLWIDSTDLQALGSLRSALWRIRRAADGLVETSGQQLRLARGVAVDVEHALNWSRGLIDGSFDAAHADADVMFVAGEILPDWYDDWLVIERERFRELRAHALECLCERLTEVGRFGRAMDVALAAVRGEPLRESAHRAVIKVCLAEGNHADALLHYRLFAKMLHQQLGLRPSRQTEELLAPVMNR
jgi:DNA-binding SARP family transcriptional activator